MSFSFYNANGYGFEAFFRPDGTLHIAVCNRKEFTTTSVDHNFLDNKWVRGSNQFLSS